MTATDDIDVLLREMGRRVAKAAPKRRAFAGGFVGTAGDLLPRLWNTVIIRYFGRTPSPPPKAA